MQNDGQWVLGPSRGMIAQGGKQKSHLLALAMPDKSRQPNAVAKVMQFDRHLGTLQHRRNLVVGKFNEHALRTEIEHTALTHRVLPTTNGYRKHLVGFDGHPANRSSISLEDWYRSPEILPQCSRCSHLHDSKECSWVDSNVFKASSSLEKMGIHSPISVISKTSRTNPIGEMMTSLPPIR